MVVPDGAVRVLDRERGLALGEPRILEGDDAADQVDALAVDQLRRLARPVVRLRRADGARERDGRRDEADLAVLVLDVELDRVHPLVDELQVLRELAVERGQRHRHVDPADLVRERARLLHRDGLGRRLRRRASLRRLRCRDGGLVVDHEARAERRGRGHAEQEPEGDGATAPASTACCLTARAEALVRLHLLEQHRHGAGTVCGKRCFCNGHRVSGGSLAVRP